MLAHVNLAARQLTLCSQIQLLAALAGKICFFRMFVPKILHFRVSGRRKSNVSEFPTETAWTLGDRAARMDGHDDRVPKVECAFRLLHLHCCSLTDGAAANRAGQALGKVGRQELGTTEVLREYLRGPDGFPEDGEVCPVDRNTNEPTCMRPWISMISCRAQPRFEPGCAMWFMQDCKMRTSNDVAMDGLTRHTLTLLAGVDGTKACKQVPLVSPGAMRHSRSGE